MSPGYSLSLTFLLAILALVAYVDLIYFKMGKFLAREYQDNIDSWEQVVEPRLRLSRDSIALSVSILRQLPTATTRLLPRPPSPAPAALGSRASASSSRCCSPSFSPPRSSCNCCSPSPPSPSP